ncbi:OmpA family protein [Mesorhizobium tamadayense]|nr:OmpA family protein [Mesorhizobium tamadayense]
MKSIVGLVLGLFVVAVSGAFFTAAAAQERDVGPKCTQWNSYRVLFKKGDGKISDETAKGLAAFVKDAGRDCGYRLYATASKEGAYDKADSIAGRRLNATSDFLKAQGVKPEMVLALSHWVDDRATDKNQARSAILYTLPKQGISCRRYEKRSPVQVALFFDSKSSVISQRVKSELEKFAAGIKDSRCNVELTATAAKEITGAKPDKTNKDLAKQRIKAIMDILTAAGIDSDRLIDTNVEYVGDRKPNTAKSRLATASLM